MPVSGLVITFAPNADGGRAAWAALDQCPALELGVREGQRVAAVLSTGTEHENKAMWRWLNELPGVDHVDVVFVSTETESDDVIQNQESNMREVCRG